MPRTFTTISTRKRGKDVSVVTEERPDGSLRVVATCEGESYEHVITVGPIDSPLPFDFTAASLQTHLDAERDKAADMAASRAQVRSLIGQLI